MCYRRILQIRRRCSSTCLALACFSRVPNPLNSYEEYQRFRHADLEEMTVQERRYELAALRQVVLLLRHPDPWHVERIKRLELALRHVA